MDRLTVIARPDATVVGMPIPGFAGLEAVTSNQDWVVTGSRFGQAFRMYVSPHVTKEQAIRAAMNAFNMLPDTVEWISATRRDQVEMCVRMDGGWLRSGA